MTAFKERAENLTLEELSNLKVANSSLLFTLNDYFSGSAKIPLFLAGNKGQGKTFNTLKALSINVHNNKDFLPAMFIYEQHKKTEVLNPRILAEPSVWGPRYEVLQGCSTQEGFMREANALIRDDYHFIFEDLVRGKMDIDKIAEELELLSEESKKGKKVLLISENPLSTYVEKISKRTDTTRLDNVLLNFGQMPYYKYGDAPERWDEYADKNSYLSFREVPQLERHDWSQLFGIYDVSAEEEVGDFLYAASRRPRSFVKFSKLFDENGKTDISMDKMIRKSIELLPSRVRSPKELKLYYYLLNFPKFLYGETQTSNEYRIGEENDFMMGMYKNFPVLKDALEDLQQSIESVEPRKLTLDSIYSLSKKWYDSVNWGISDTLDNIIAKKKLQIKSWDAIEVIRHPVAFNFLNTFDILERNKNKSITRDTLVKKLDSELTDYQASLRSEIGGYYSYASSVDASKNYIRPNYLSIGSKGHLERVNKDYLLLSKPFQIAFHDALYEAPTLDVLKAFGI